MGLVELLGGGVFGALMGFIEKPVAQYMETRAKVVDYAHVEKMQELQFKQDLHMAEKELLIEGVKADSAILQESYKHDASFGTTSTWVANVRSLVRPLSIPITLGAALYDPMFYPSFLLVISWFFASRVRAAYAPQ